MEHLGVVFFLIKYFTQYLQMKNKNILLIATTSVTNLQLFQHAQTTHTQFRILVRNYLYVLLQPSEILETLECAHVIIIDEMSMMTNVMCNRTLFK
jgi:hypothetical protein